MRKAPAAAILLCLTFIKAASGQSPDFKGETVDLNIGFGPGGGYDTYGRVLAAHLGRFLPGSPTVVARNMPGAGGIKLANYMYQSAPANGTQLAIFASSTALEPLMGNDLAKYDPSKFSWLGSMDQDTSYCGVWTASNAPRTFEEMRRRQAVFGTSGPGAISYQHVLVLKNVLGAKVRTVNGYEGTRSVSLAMERGEVDAACGLFGSSIRADWLPFLESGRLKLFIQMGPRRSHEFGDVPSVYDFVRTPEEQQVLDVHFKQIKLARPVTAPPGTPKPTLELLRTGFDRTMKDPSFLAAARQANLSINPTTGPDVESLISKLVNYPPSILSRARAAIGR